MSPPPSSRATVTADGGVLTIHLPPSGFARSWWRVLVCVALLVGVTAMASACASFLLRADGWVERCFCVAVLGLCVFGYRPIVLLVTRYHLAAGVVRGTVVAGSGRLYVHERRVLRACEHVWDVGAIVCLDEEDGALCVLSDGRLTPMFAGRDPLELCWLAQTLRSHLHVGADPTGGPDEIVVSVHLPGWSLRRGFLLLEQGRIRLRPRFQPLDGLVLRAGSHTGRGFSLTAGTLGVEPDDVRWGIAEGGQAVLRIWLRVPEEDEPLALELSSDRPGDLREGMARFWMG
jgi:hypothetical protein